jgi:adenylate cyclase
MLKKIALSPWTALITLLLVLSIRVADTPFVESIRLRYFDTLITNAQPTYNDIYSVNIDESTLDKYGQWPFDRRVYAELITELYKRNAGIVVFNVMMPEKDRLGGDSELVKVLKETPVILTSAPAAVSKNEPHPPGIAIINSQYIDSLTSYPGLISNIKEIEDASLGVGIVSTMPEVDGVTRRLPLVAGVNGKPFPSVSMEVLRVAANDTTVQIKLQPNGVEKMRIPKFGPITTDEKGRIWIDWSQQSKSVSAANLPEDFANAVVVVGVSAAGLGNPVATAKGAIFPQDVQAAVIGTLMNQVNIARPDYADGAEMLAMLVAGVILLLLTRWIYVGLGTVIVMAGAGVYGSFYAFEHHLLLLDATAFTVMIVLVALHAYGVKFVSEFLQKQAIKKQFAGYCSKEVVELLQKDPDLIKRGVKKEISICFSDLRGFTPLGESFGDDVGGLTKVMNGYMDAITQPILKANGMVIKYIGDASMHIHNAPIDDPDHPKTAVEVGLKMVKAVKEYSKILEAQGRPGVKMGAGINTGLGYIGEMGSTERHSYDVLGDAISTTARIESKCKEYGCVLLVGEETVRRCGNDFFFLKIDDLAVKGKTVGVGIYTVLDDITTSYHKAKDLHNDMHTLYRAQKFDEAITLCEKLKTEFDDKMVGYYNMWIERCEYQKTQDLPADWNGTFIATTK